MGCSSRKAGRVSISGAMLTMSVCQRRGSPFRHAANAFQHGPEQTAELYYFSLLKKIFPEQPYHFQRFSLLGHLASQVEAGRSGRAHPELERDPADFHIRDRMILQSEAHLENRIVSRRGFFAEGQHELDE